MTIAALVAAAGLALIVERGGMLAWAGAIAGVALLVKGSIRPTSRDLFLILAAASVWALIWVGTTYYVVSTWESGEVVELGIETPDGTHTARVWILDVDRSPVLVYDAAPEIAEALLHGNPVTVRRDGQLTLERPLARRIDDVPQDEVDAIFRLMDEKYGRRNLATDVFYRFLGRQRDRTVMIVKLEE
jgi:hypothetical protein